jgi:hypothetical protein
MLVGPPLVITTVVLCTFGSHLNPDELQQLRNPLMSNIFGITDQNPAIFAIRIVMHKKQIFRNLTEN